MDEPVKVALAVAYGYLLGSVSLAYLIGRLVKGTDLRQVGSGTLGSSNVWQSVGKAWVFPVGVFDLLGKGLTPVLFARYLLDLGLEAQAAAGFMAILGHNWPVFLRFHGGRGVTPTLGVLLALARVELALFVVVAVVGWRLTNSSAVWVLVATTLLPVWSLATGRPAAIVWLMVAILATMVIKRLVSNSPTISSIPTRKLLWNRLIHDRDIADRDAWVRRGTANPKD